MSGSASTVFQAGWTKSIFVTLPAVVSLDFVSAFGLALVWLWVFTLVALFAVYELWMLTGRWGPSSGSCDVGEGRDALEGEAPCKVGFRNSRGYKVRSSPSLLRFSGSRLTRNDTRWPSRSSRRRCTSR